MGTFQVRGSRSRRCIARADGTLLTGTGIGSGDRSDSSPGIPGGAGPGIHPEFKGFEDEVTAVAGWLFRPG